MTVYARTDIQGLLDITPGKLYEAEEDGEAFYIRDDAGDVLCALWEGCSHLNGGDWERVEASSSEKVATGTEPVYTVTARLTEAQLAYLLNECPGALITATKGDK